MPSTSSPTHLATALATLLLTGCASFAAAPPATAPVRAEAAAPAPAAAAMPTRFPDFPLTYKKAVLPNGLTLLVHTDREAPLVAVHVIYQVGAKDETPGRTGFAHLFEHLMFNGSEHHDDEFFRPLEAAGASLINGTTNSDRTNFYETVPKEALDLALWLEADRMGNLLPAITQAKLDEQRGVVKNEKRQREGEPFGKVEALLAEALYPAGHPYSWTPIGSMADLDAAKLDDVREWFRRYYGPNNAVIALSGDVTFEEAQQKVARWFGSIAPSSGVSRQLEWNAPLAAPRRVQAFDKVTQPRLYRVWNVPKRGTPDALYLAYAADVLAADKASRLYRRLVTEEQLATGVSADVEEGTLASQFAITVSVKPGGDPARIEAVLDEELAKLRAEPIPDALLQRLKTSLYVSRIGHRESLSAKAAELAACQAFLGGQAGCDAQWTTLQAATPRQLADAAARWLGPDHLTLTVFPEPQLSAAARAAADDAARKRLPAVGEPAGIVLPALDRFTLANGLPVVLAQRHDVPLVRLSLFWPYGTAVQPDAGQMEMLMGMLSEGADGLTAEQLTEAYGALGSGFYTDLDADSAAVQLESPVITLRESLTLFARNLLRPSFPADALERRKSRKLAGLVASTASPGGILGLNQFRLMYGEHPYGRFNSLPRLEASTKALTTDALRTLHTRALRPDGAQLLVVGDVTPEALKALLDPVLGTWQRPSLPAPDAALPAVAQPAPRVFLFDLPGAAQSLVAAADLGVTVLDPQREAMELANTVLGGLFTSRLNANLREKRGWSYGASSGLGEARGPALFVAQAQIETPHTAAAMAEMKREIAELSGAKPPTAVELDQATKSLVRALPAQAETARGVLGLLQRQLGYGLPEDTYSGYPARLAALSSAEVAAATRRLAQPGQLTWFVVGDLKTVEAPIRALGLGPVTVLDARGTVVR